jgi:segregation and condensation protein B
VTDEGSPPPLERIVEALLFVGGAPLSSAGACEAVRGLTPEQFTQAIATLNSAYRQQGRPYRIQAGAQGYELVLRPAFRWVAERLTGSVREARLTQAQVETLALVAYRQPVTRQEVDSARGASSLGVLRQLVRLGLIAVQRGSSSDEMHYATTARFLSLYGLRGLDDLPRTQDFLKT